MEAWQLDLLSRENSSLLLVDYQPAMFKGVASGDRNQIKASAVAAARAASIMEVPVILTSIWPEGNGPYDPDIAGLFREQGPIARSVPSFDALEDRAVYDAVMQTNRQKLVLSGLWTSMCFAFTAIHGLREGLEVYGLMDAAGDASPDAHHFGIERMLQAGVVPLTWETLTSEWMHDWGSPYAERLREEVYGPYDVVMGM